MIRVVSILAFAAALAACGEKPPADGAKTEAEAPQIVQPPPPPADPLAVGSQDAKDDLYCANIILISNPEPDGALNPTDEAVLRKAQSLGIMLGESGINKLVAEKAAHATHGAVIGEAYADLADRDLKAKTPRIKLEDCYARARALPPLPQ